MGTGRNQIRLCRTKRSVLQKEKDRNHGGITRPPGTASFFPNLLLCRLLLPWYAASPGILQKPKLLLTSEKRIGTNVKIRCLINKHLHFSLQESFEFLFAFITYCLKQEEPLKQWLLPRAKAAFEEQKQKFYDKTYQYQPSIVNVPHEFLVELFGFLSPCFKQPPFMWQQLLRRAYEILNEQISRNIQEQELYKRRLA